MAKIFAANSSGVLVDNENIEGLRSIDYQLVRDQFEVAALGTHERVGVYYGMNHVKVRLRVASTSPKLDQLANTGNAFQVVANLKHGQAARSVAFDECFMEGKEFAMSASGHGETIYSFSATRVREEDAS